MADTLRAPEAAPPAGPATAPRPRLASTWAFGGSGLVRKLRILIFLLLVWEALVRIFDVNPLLFPPASTVLMAWLRGVVSGELIGFAAQSLQVLLTGMLIGVAVAILLVTLATTTRFGRDLLETVTSMFNPLPAIALMPLALIWFGLGTGSLIFVIVHAVLWPFAISAYTGFVTVPQTLIRVGQNFGLRGWSLVSGILLPAAFPYLLTGAKLGWAFAWRTIIAAEMVFGVTGSRGGLGWYIYTKRYSLDTPEVFAGLITIIVIGLLVENLVFRFVERRTVVRWGMQAG
jgi:NitT/TauT family transport system permease protein